MTPRLLTIMGSGETAPTMVKVHRQLLERLGSPPVPAVLLDTPFGFQENAKELAARVVHYFDESLRAPIDVASAPADALAGPGPLGGGDDPFASERLVSSVRSASYVFAGPGSPTYALRKWRGTVIPSLLHEKLRHGGAVTFSSAAALTLGVRTVPVYEVYKVGEDPYWLEGLDVLAEAGLNAAVIPHYNNAEGGTHDTRFCYLGERRLSRLEPELPDGAFVLGVDEHTALMLDLDAGTAEIAGLGVVTVRAGGRSQTFAVGESLKITDLLDAAVELARGGGGGTGIGDGGVGGDGSGLGDGGAAEAGGVGSSAATAGSAAGAAGGDSGGGGAVGYTDSPLVSLVRGQEAAFSEALSQRDVPGAVAAVLDLEDQITQWSHDIPAGDALDRARASLRSLVVELGRVGETGARDPREVLGPFVEAMLELRTKARADRRFEDSDGIRDRLVELGIEVRDTASGSEWLIAEA
jgi:hypothetical protein